MELSDYIEKTLSQIIDGVRKTASNKDYLIAPHTVKFREHPTKVNDEPSLVEFEVAISVTEETKGGINKIIVLEGSKSNSESHKVKFSVPVYFHGTQVPPKDNQDS